MAGADQALIQTWLDVLATNHDPRQVAQTQQVLDDFLLHHQGRSILNLTERDVQAYVNEVGGQDPRAIAEIVMQLQVLSLFFDFLRAKHVVHENAVKAFRRKWFAALITSMSKMERGGQGNFRFVTGRFAQRGDAVAWSFHGDLTRLADVAKDARRQ